ncbi:hypothetical protein B0I32_1074 [Nonomuraea fuscirosea]|uniref:Uncharacterized protein n=1 Tax=Nonomuraea fuscirosea TaxID=1291556 RepID=A0A2T0N0D8_9ACTN|nr:hypothetical protein B0I32_1074 [Nonomuraea fuscirosea]
MARALVASPAGELAHALSAELGRRGIASQVSECEGIALVGVWSVGLAVWCEWSDTGWRFRWGMDASGPGGRLRYTACPGSAVETAGRRIASLYEDRRRCGGE